MARFSLAVLTSHPIQYQAPLFRKLASSPEIELMVYFCSDMREKGKIDQGFGLPVVWDVPLLDGYPHKFLSGLGTASTPNPERFWSCFNPGVVSELVKRDYDAILIHGYSLATHWLAFLTAFFRKIPVLLHGETVLPPGNTGFSQGMRKKILSALFKKVAMFLYVGTRSREFYEAFGVPKERLFFSPYSVDNEFFMRLRSPERGEKTKRELGIPKEMPVILFAAKFLPRKRPLDCLKAFARLDKKSALVMVGDGELRNELLRYKAEHHLDNLFFPGFKNQKELPDFYSMADIFLLPSSFEPWGVVVNEAMCFGLPVVTTDGVASAADLVRDGRNGFIYPAGDVAALADRLNRLLSSEAERKRMGEHSRQTIASWNYDQCVEGILEALAAAKALD